MPSSPHKVALIGECMLELRGQAFGTLQQGYGGDTFNTAVYLARCGAPLGQQALYATALGDDALSEGLLARWEAEGVDCSLVRRLPGRMPGLYQISVDERGERSFTYWRDTSAAKAYFDVDITPLEQRAVEWGALYVSGISLAVLPVAGRERLLALMRTLRARGATVVFDNNYRPRLWPAATEARKWFCLAFEAASIALLTADDHQALLQLEQPAQALEAARALPTAELVVKRGAEPALLRGPDGGWLEVPAERVARVVDTTAAGDAFGAGYLCQRLAGAAPAEAAAFGNRLAARVIQHPGAVIAREVMADLC
ncbi:sugar kinase [Ideonella sp. BN130291]|uniref:sugar kinase n=1 Tax=Ideonella sp. BN130291 TaxID=3112940 RepID=UPI002E266D26|nr:sugar kinase [Ideonella sp. BN130291]